MTADPWTWPLPQPEPTKEELEAQRIGAITIPTRKQLEELLTDDDRALIGPILNAAAEAVTYLINSRNPKSYWDQDRRHGAVLLFIGQHFLDKGREHYRN